MTIDNDFRNAAERLIIETSQAATQGRLDRITREKRRVGRLLVVIAVVFIPVLFALFGWLNAQPVDNRRYAPATSPNTLAPTVTEGEATTEVVATPPSTTDGPTTTAAATTSSQGVIAGPQPGCKGENSLEGATGTTVGAEEAAGNGPPGPPISISAGPCEGSWTTYTQESGLPKCVCDLGVSPDGTAWVLSEFGDITTFNGTSWTPLHTGTLDVRALDFAQDGTLWITTNTGVFTREAGEWIQQGDTPWGEDIAVSPDGSVWIYSDGSLSQFDGSSWTEHPRGFDLSPPPEGVGTGAFIDVAPDGTLWIATGNTFGSYDGTTWTSHLPASGFTPQGMTVAPDGSVWMASASNSSVGGPDVRLSIPVLEEEGYGLVRYDGEVWVGYPIPTFADIAFASDGTIWAVDAFIGAFRFDGQEWVHYTEEHGLTANQLELVAVAPDGTVWFKTFLGDVVRYQPTS